MSGLSSGQERKAAERQARRRRVQRVARKLFAERGFQKTTIEDVARKAGLSVGAIYLYFKSKEELYVSLLEESLNTVHKELTRIHSAAGGAREHFREAWRFAVRFARENPDCYRIFVFLSSPSIRQSVRDEVLAEVGTAALECLGTLREILEAGIAAGVYPSFDVSAQVHLVASSFLSLVLLHETRANLAPQPPAPAPLPANDLDDTVAADVVAASAPPPPSAPAEPDLISGHADVAFRSLEAGLFASGPRASLSSGLAA